MKSLALLTFIILTCSGLVTSQRSKVMKKFRGEERESFYLGLIEAIEISKEGGKYKYIYNSLESNTIDSILDPLMAKYEILYNPHLTSFCGTFDDPAYDAGFDFAMDSMISENYGKHFIDSLIKVAKKEYKISQDNYLNSLEKAESVPWTQCEGPKFKNTDSKAINWDEKFSQLRILDTENNNFEIVSNCLNSKIIEFNLSINEEGQVYRVDSITVKEYCGVYEPIDKYNTLIKFITETIQGTVPYPVCIYRKDKKKYLLRQSICFRWTD